MDVLPVDCIAQILSFLTGEEACRLTVVSRTFRSAVDSDVFWNQFLRRFCKRKGLATYALEPPPHVVAALSSKDIFFRLYRHGVHIFNPRKPTRPGRIYYFVPNPSDIFAGIIFLSGSWELAPIPDDPLSYLERSSDPLKFCRGRSYTAEPDVPNVRILTLKTTYAIYFVFRHWSKLCSFPDSIRLRFYLSSGQWQERQEHFLVINEKNYRVSEDGWMEVEMTKFTPPCSSSIKISFHLEELPPRHITRWPLKLKGRGIEVRLVEDSNL